LWFALQQFIPQDLLPPGMTLKELMDTWIMQAGYPIITFERLYDEQNRVIVSQVKFVFLLKCLSALPVIEFKAYIM